MIRKAYKNYVIKKKLFLLDVAIAKLNRRKRKLDQSQLIKDLQYDCLVKEADKLAFDLVRLEFPINYKLSN